MLKRISDTSPSHDTCSPTERYPLCIANYKQKGKSNSELLIPTPGPTPQGHSSVINNKEIAIPDQSQCAPFTVNTNARIFSYSRKVVTEAGHRHTLKYTTVVFKYAPKNDSINCYAHCATDNGRLGIVLNRQITPKYA
jgi:hypothetical protein